MRSRWIERRDLLKEELADGENQVRQLEGKITELRQTLLRISGAVQVLDEMIAEEETTGKADAG